MFCSNSTLLRASAPETRTLQSPHVCFQYGSMDGDLTGSAPRAPHFYPQHFNRTGQNKLNHWICLLHLYKEQTVLCLRAKRKPSGDVQDKTNTWRLVVRTGSCCHTAGKGSTRKPRVEPLRATQSLSAGKCQELCLALSIMQNWYGAPMATVPDNFPYTSKYT